MPEKVAATYLDTRTNEEMQQFEGGDNNNNNNIPLLPKGMQRTPIHYIPLHILRNAGQYFRVHFSYLEVSGCYPHVVLLARVVELCETPVNESEFPILVIDHHIVWLDVPMHDAHAVAVVQGLEELVQVVTDVVVSQGLVQLLEVGIVHMFENESRGSETTNKIRGKKINMWRHVLHCL